MSFWKDKKVLVTGGCGFVGSFLTEFLLAAGARVRIADLQPEGWRQFLAPHQADFEYCAGDLRDVAFACQACRAQDVVMHLAAVVGGVGYNIKHSADLLYDNSLMALQVMDAAVREKVGRILITSSACVYPRFCTIPTPETEGFKDIPEPTNLGYGWSKRFAEVVGACYAEQHAIQVAIARPYNCYGPRDDFRWETSHVIAALVRKVVEGQNPLIVWGDGSQSRSFLYVEDFARGLMEVTEKHAQCDPVNIGAQEEVTIKTLIETIVELAGTPTKIQYDTSKPTGQPRRCCDVAKLRATVGYAASTSMRDGLRNTIAWYRQHPETRDKQTA